MRGIRNRYLKIFRVMLLEHPFRRAGTYIVGLCSFLTAVILSADALLGEVSGKPDIISKKTLNFEVSSYWFLLLAFISMYFLLASFLSSELALRERRLRERQQAFTYDNRGTLLNYGEPNIAFRIATFKGMLGGIVDFGVTEKTLIEALTKSGQTAAVDFAEKLPTIYETDVRAVAAREPWAGLSFQRKLNEWAEYDSSTGWGIVTIKHRADNDSVEVSFTHFEGLFSDPYAEFFPSFLQGYCQTVLAEILSQHNGKQGSSQGKISSYGSVQYISTEKSGPYNVSLVFSIF